MKNYFCVQELIMHQCIVCVFAIWSSNNIWKCIFVCLGQNDPRRPLLSIRSFRQDKMEHFPWNPSFPSHFFHQLFPLKAFYHFVKTRWNTFLGFLLFLFIFQSTFSIKIILSFRQDKMKHFPWVSSFPSHFSIDFFH